VISIDKLGRRPVRIRPHACTTPRAIWAFDAIQPPRGGALVAGQAAGLAAWSDDQACV